MGLTIYYTLRSSTRSPQRARKLVEQMRQLAMDLPMHTVGEIREYAEGKANFRDYDHDSRDFDLLLDARQSAKCPWNKRHTYDVPPTRVIACHLWPGLGCEPLNIGLCQYPATIERDFRYEDDERFQHKDPKRLGYIFDYDKFKRYARRVEGQTGKRLFAHEETPRQIKTRLSGWYWGAFCKTQYASNPRAGGLPNFLRCHITAITLLDRIAKLPTMKVYIDDEGHYGPAHYSDDWREAQTAGRKATYVDHPATYNVKTLIEEVGEYNVLVAGMAGLLGDAAQRVGLEQSASIQEYPSFESLEFKGCQREELQPFLLAMQAAGEKVRAATPAGVDDD